ncbi:hypothetical protein CERSUDRAFT_157518 [Gelatoporia subvermispora B]|uniref:PX domain-containing protein n=1 Tax=Ceriporiopsis subvermispora (strain B) TaxID=914234 RepID=M2QF05_CERS8|nr:hypothetical protein CERSUDRAFT_157518 [Gelatoporia subvermispora B]
MPESSSAFSKLAFFLPIQRRAVSRPPSHAEGFDSGINSSTAWTVSLNTPEGELRKSQVEPSVNVDSLSDEERDPGMESADEDADLLSERGRPARALYGFQGKPEFRELTHVDAGDELEIVKEDAGEGWCLARLVASRSGREGHQGELGLLPSTYYTYTSDFAVNPELDLSPSKPRRREASDSTITPRGSPPRQSAALPIVPQNTGEWFPSFRRSLLGGKSLNRFSSFVTSGAEEWVLQGTGEEPAPPTGHAQEASSSQRGGESNRTSMLGASVEVERHFVEAGPAWRTKVPAFRVLVHSPSKRTSTLSGAYTMYALTSIFEAPPDEESYEDGEAEEQGEVKTIRLTVHRRFSHFVALHTALTRQLPGIVLPPLPEKQYAGRFSDDFVEARRGDLERYINRVVRHPVARYAEVLTFFLGCESDWEWKKQLPYYLSLPPKGPSFYAHVYHPAFNVDAEEAAEAGERFASHTRAVSKGVQSMRGIFGKVREARIEMSHAERLLSYSLLSLITSKPLAAAPAPGISEEDEEDADKKRGHMNEDGAWCWREGCEQCLKLTKALQKTSETLQTVADLYDDHARRTLLATHESLKSVAHPSTLYQAVVDTHDSTLTRYREATQEGNEDEEVAARCETVLNTTMAEMETYHTQKVEDFQDLAKEHLDGEIAFYEQVLARLRTARRAFDDPQYEALGESPRQPSLYERELENPRLFPTPLPQPCPHVFDSAPMRPVSVAIQEGVGLLLGGAGNPARTSVFGKFW